MSSEHLYYHYQVHLKLIITKSDITLLSDKLTWFLQSVLFGEKNLFSYIRIQQITFCKFASSFYHVSQVSRYNALYISELLSPNRAGSVVKLCETGVENIREGREHLARTLSGHRAKRTLYLEVGRVMCQATYIKKIS